MTVPALIFGILVSSLMGASLHLIFGGSLWRLLLFLLMGWIGFWGGHYLGESFGWTFWSVGPLHLGAALLGGFILLFLSYWLSLTRPEKES